ncbi:MAG TPA: AbrB/MazE/SpoVT family DNA-binding domain-containing protein [Acidimicrobiales bacterium]|nr:AbrB/MazE/SpoVT family DNA-binding domain-containing protein [Acidimicrobiales bacterium]
MATVQERRCSIYKVSSRGQFSLPADARRRWGIEHGGEVELFDLGDCVVMLPVGRHSARASLARALTAERYRQHVGHIDDPDLRDE